ncbi:DUF7527 domain-containing protein [Salinibaculum rarum]|uniref:DUF7527 domain-containing protein n=1 Tax=Salinibaculum rarum TaxID=3058903 RepID=UPI00265DFEB3|nr:hypothetical protein [Salinibaculum sp. KK48]
MSTPVTERVDDWTDRPFGGGYRELQDLAESEFSGVVRAGGAELYMTKGTVVGILRGSISDFEDASGTIYNAPTDALPLLAVMQERSDEVRAKYYSEDTGISEVDKTLEDGKFTGYVELSENVLSGDYYLVYHQGHSMSVAYVGNAEQLLTDDEAFERADDEVGIFEVRPVDIEPIEIPEPAEPDEPEPATAVTDDSETDEDIQDGESVADPSPTETADTAIDPDPIPDDQRADEQTTSSNTEPAADTDTVSAAMETEAADGPDSSSDEDDTEPDDDPEPALDQSETDSGADEPSTGPNREQAVDSDAGGTEPTGKGRPADAGEEDTEQSTAPETVTASETVERDPEPTPEQTTTTSDSPEPDTEPGGAVESQQDVPPTPTVDAHAASGQAEGGLDASTPVDDPSSLETHAVPSLDPERTSTGSQAAEPRRDTPGRETGAAAEATASQPHSTEQEPTTDDERATTNGESGEEEPQPTQPTPTKTEADQHSATTATEPDQSTQEPADPSPESSAEPAVEETEPDESVDDQVAELQELLTERETEIKRLEADLESAESERESLREKLQQVRAERDELEEQVEKRERDLKQLEEELGAATDAQQRMTPQEALAGTDLFVRYRSKGKGTLEKAHSGKASRDEVVENLRLEKHTQFDASISAVGGREYEEFLEETVAYKFVRWAVEQLLFEIQDTGHTETLSDLYDALPKVNRVELNGAVTVTDTENGQETESTETFDVVFRERMGDPLLVANINDSRQGASEAMMEGLITAAERVGQTTDEFASAFLVTESFFEPEALETVAEATRGGLLSRDKRKSFVNLSRKRGYHLCLVEARNQNFHLEVPEL